MSGGNLAVIHVLSFENVAARLPDQLTARSLTAVVPESPCLFEVA